MKHAAYLTPQEFMFQISSQSVKPFELELGEHRDMESKNYYIDKCNECSLSNYKYGKCDQNLILFFYEI